MTAMAIVAAASRDQKLERMNNSERCGRFGRPSAQGHAMNVPVSFEE
jgi:hypothetical protein